MKERMKMKRIKAKADEKEELMLKILSFTWQEQRRVMKKWCKKTGLANASAYYLIKKLEDKGLVVKSKLGRVVQLRKTPNVNPTLITDEPIIAPELKTHKISHDTIVKNNQDKAYGIIIDNLKGELLSVKQQASKDRVILERYIEYLQEQIRAMRAVEINRLNREQNNNNMRNQHE